MFTPPFEVEAVLAPFGALFTRPSWQRAQALLSGVLLAPANCVITAALRVLGLSDDKHFQNYHRVLNRARWSARYAAGILLRLLVKAFVPAGPVVIGLDDTVERRRGVKISGRSMYRDAVRSSWGCFQKTSGLRWIGLHLITPVRWAKRTWALPFLTALAPSGNNPPYVRAGRRHKPLSERARGLIGQAQRWLPGRDLIVVADGGYAVLDLLAWCQRLARPVTMISRLRMDGALYKPAPPRRPGQKGRRQVKGERLPTPKEYLASRQTKWRRVLVNWYGGARRWVEVADATAVWWRAGKPPVHIRWVLVRDPKGRVRPLALLCTNVNLPVGQIVGHFVRRWAMETTFQETRVYFGVEGQRQWNDLAIARATPLRLALFSLVTLIVDKQVSWQTSVRQAAWYKKALPTFSDALAQVRRCLWRQMSLSLSQKHTEREKIPAAFFAHLGELLAHAA